MHSFLQLAYFQEIVGTVSILAAVIGIPYILYKNGQGLREQRMKGSGHSAGGGGLAAERADQPARPGHSEAIYPGLLVTSIFYFLGSVSGILAFFMGMVFSQQWGGIIASVAGGLACGLGAVVGILGMLSYRSEQLLKRKYIWILYPVLFAVALLSWVAYGL